MDQIWVFSSAHGVLVPKTKTPISGGLKGFIPCHADERSMAHRYPLFLVVVLMIVHSQDLTNPQMYSRLLFQVSLQRLGRSDASLDV